MDIRQKLFELRSYAPIPFLVLMLVFADPTLVSIACGFAVVTTGELVRLWGVGIAGSETRTTGPVGGTFLVTRGPFAFVRNPLYVGNMAIYFGFGIMSRALFPWLAIVALLYFRWQYAMIVSLEEEYLGRTFGEEYRRYAGSVPRFFPNFKRFASRSNEQPELNWYRGVLSEKSTLLAIGGLTAALLIIALWERGS